MGVSLEPVSQLSLQPPMQQTALNCLQCSASGRVLLTISALLVLSAHFSVADSLQAFRDRQEKIKAVTQAAVNTTVAITASDMSRQRRRGSGTGSGVIISAEGLILTAAHVTQATGKELTITFSDGREVAGVALGANRTLDAGMARITEEGPWPFSKMGQSDIIAMGTWCVATGHPGGFRNDRPPPVRLGRIWHRDQYSALYSDCTLIGGDSGGPLFDLEGRVIGIHSSIGGSLSTNRHAAIDSFRQHWDRMLKGNIWGELHLDPDKGDLATMGVELDWNSENGALVRAVRSNAPAALAGVIAGDVIVQFAGDPISSSIELLRKLSEMKAGDLASISVTRGEEVVDMEITLTDYKTLTAPPLPSEKHVPDAPFLGVELSTPSSRNGARIDHIVEASPAEKAGIAVGDVITALNHKAIDSPESFVEEILKRRPEESITLAFIRDEEKRSVTVILGRQ